MTHTFWTDLQTAVVAIDIQTTEYVALGMAASPDRASSHCFLSMISTPDQIRSPTMIVEATCAFVDSLFERWPFRKLYLDSDDVSLAQFAGIEEFLVEEGVFSEHVYRAGAWRDVHRFALTRTRWKELKDLYVARLGLSYPQHGG